MYGEHMLAAIVPNSAKPFNFHTEFDMTEEMVSFCFHAPLFLSSFLVKSLIPNMYHPQALRVSDHYPVEVDLHIALPLSVTDHAGDIVDTQNASVNKTVIGNEQHCNLLILTFFLLQTWRRELKYMYLVSVVMSCVFLCVCFSPRRDAAGRRAETAEGKPPAGKKKTSTSDLHIKTQTFQNGIRGMNNRSETLRVMFFTFLNK